LWWVSSSRRQDPRRAGPRVEAEAAVVNKREVAAVIRVFRRRHPRSVPRTSHFEPVRERPRRSAGHQDVRSCRRASVRRGVWRYQRTWAAQTPAACGLGARASRLSRCRARCRCHALSGRGRCRRRPLRPGIPARVRLWFGREGYSAADPRRRRAALVAAQRCRGGDHADPPRRCRGNLASI
jgi:hypothetical protein